MSNHVNIFYKRFIHKIRFFLKMLTLKIKFFTGLHLNTLKAS